ncbi:tRNA epoxyqueuosine(34) reductase QueG [Clostridium mediterraneense]|uniref:tRNA epoxyqueuosine(34) reductase QueG n=1 Tax=Clostridium mediterraneense TaxID=1805472 RepID=UPI000834D34F|nr:tRNA epoxyqueuosine(34) reductase QueG [Clostridium mediterraneense]
MDLRQEIIDYCKEIGLDTIGFIKCRKFTELYDFFKERKEKGLENEFEEQDIDIRITPNHYMEEGKTIISIAFPYLHDTEYEDNGFSLYTRGEDYHNVVHKYLKQVCEFIESKGGKALAFTDSNTLPERYIAYISGVGFIGKNNMLITKKYGSYVFLGEIITDLDIAGEDVRTADEIQQFKECGECEICYNECPTKSINRVRKNCNICMSYITQKKEINKVFIKKMDGRIFGCDSCQLECPYNRDKEYSKIEEFKPKDFMRNVTTEDMISIDNANFKKTFKQTSCGWRGKNIIIRNAMIKRHLVEKENIKDVKSNSEYINDYKNRLLDIDKL